jgi:hypothetical protein
VKVLSSEERIIATSTSPSSWTDFGLMLRENMTEKVEEVLFTGGEWWLICTMP